ncbi:SDR family NAD(P)-dependent oxidoreductase [Streptomyces sp. NPDC012589]
MPKTPENDRPHPSDQPVPTTVDDVREWLVAAVAEAAGVDPGTVDPDRPIAELGLGSRQLVTLGAGLAELTGRTPDASAVFDHPTVTALAAAALHGPGAGPDTRPDVPAPRPHSGPAGEPSGPVGDDIAIVSMACRFPGGADDPEALWQLLAEGRDAVTDVPPGRWNTDGLHDPDPEAAGTAYSLRGGYLAGIDRFDAPFFGISPREAEAMDPQQRLLLETAWETVERAGIVPGTLDGTATGVYVGLYDSGYLAAAGLDRLDGHVGTGSASSVASGRIAYSLGLQGPAVTVDTACSSSLVALYLAARALADGTCDLALAGGATLLVTPRGHVEFSRLRGLSPSGRCSPFSADADGVVWAEGCGLVLLKRLADARRDGDRVLAVIKGSAVNQDGRSQGLSAPSGPAQERVLRAALDAAGLRPGDLDHVETHGTGTRLGDPIEGRALARVFGPDRPAGRPLAIGSLKSNLGHTQAAAGIAGVIKTVLALRHETLPASLHAGTPTEHVDWADGGLRVVAAAEPWPRDPQRVRRAGVSAFGISGTNAHVILEEAPDPAGAGQEPAGPAAQGTPGEPAAPSRLGTPPEAAPAEPAARPLLFPLSARTPAALRGQAGRLADALAARPGTPPTAVAAALAHHRTHFEHRAVLPAADRDTLLTALRSLAAGTPDPDLVAGPARARTRGKVAFVLPGQGSQWTGMARDLLVHDPVFADELDRCDAALRPHTGWSVTAVLRGDDGAPSLGRVDVVQPVLFAVMVSLAAVWRARGVEPDAVIGHSQGEVAAACIAGALSLNDAAAVVALRGQALTGLSGTGTMAVVALSPGDAEARIAEAGGRVSVAAVNSDRSTVLAGDTEPLEHLLDGLHRDQVFARRLDVDYASHTARVEPLRRELLAELDGVLTSPTPVTWYSTVTGEPVTGELDAGYWYTNLREPVRFAPAVERMIADGHRFFVELAPHPALLTALRTVAGDDDDVVVVGSLRRDEDGPACLDRASAELHVRGLRVDWRRLVPRTAPADLPTYAFEPHRYWSEPAAAATAPGLFDRAAHPLLGLRVRSADAARWTFRAAWSQATAAWLADHEVFGRTVVCATTLLELCRAALAEARPDGPPDVTGLLLPAPLTLPAAGTVEVSVEVDTSLPVPEVTVHSRPAGRDGADWVLHATASAQPALPATGEEPPLRPDDAASIWTEETYDRLAARGLGYGPAFRGVREVLRTGDDTLLARLSLPRAAHDDADGYPVHPALLDAALQTAAVFDPGDRRVLLPVAVGRCTLPPGGAGDLTAAVRRTGSSGPDVTLDVRLWDTDGMPAGRLDDVRLRASDPADLDGTSENARHLYEVAWTALPDRAPGAPGPDGTWSVREPEPPLTEALAAAGVPLAAPGARPDVVVRLWPGAGPQDDPAAAAHALAAAALTELRDLIALPPDRAPARTLWVTRGAVAARPEDTVPALAQSVLWGLARSARAEHPGLGLVLLDLDPADAPDDTVAALRSAAARDDEPELACRAGTLLTPRLVRARPGTALALPAGDTYALTGFPAAPRADAVPAPAPGPGQVLVEVRALALGDDAVPAASAGVITACGPGVDGLAPGARVTAPAGSAPGSGTVADAASVTVLPDDVPFTVAAAGTDPAGPPPVVLPVTAAREAVRRTAPGGRPVVLDLAGRPAQVPADGTVLITGGLGAIGRTVARLLAGHGVPRLLLTSRRGADDPRAEDVTAELTALGARVEIAACDVADPDALADLLAGIDTEAPLRGVVHCAGVLADAAVTELTADRLAHVLRPKTDGAAHLHRLTAGRPLDLFLLLSSAAGVLGSPGQANYAAANAFLDQLAHHRRALGLPALSLSFGAWADEGLAAAHADLDRLARRGHRALTPEQGRDLIGLALRRTTAHLVASALDLPRLRDTVTGGPAATTAVWRALLPAPRTAPGTGTAFAQRLARLPEAERGARVLALVREEAARALGLPGPDPVRPDEPLRDLGMDSVTAVDLRNRIGARVGARLPATLLFDHPTPARLTAHLLTGVFAAGPGPAPARPAPAAGTPAADEPVAVVGTACRLPGGADDPESLWRLLAEGRDAIGPFPSGRWDVESLYDPDPDTPGTSYVREGGFLDDIESFDAAFFGITPKEAAAMDPQQRLLLETAWEALERAGIVPGDLEGGTAGVYVGMFGSDYLAGSRLDQLDGYVGTGSALSVASGRLAYTLGLHGPAMTVDTACSSSLVATHLAVQALRSGECDLALAGGATLMVTPQTFVEFSRLRGLSPTGRCRSFSDDADGAVWAEGAGMVVLKRLGDAHRDGDRVLAVLRGTAVNQDGRSQGLSAPHGPAQEQVIRRALERSGLRPGDIDHIEAHGTGTTLGDPIEAHALAQVFGGDRPAGRPLHLGSLKSNIGHVQAAAGIAGLIKVVESLRHETLPRSLHAGTPTRHVDWDGSGLHLLREPVAWPRGERVRRAGVSAFGISGTNAHVVVEEAPPAPAATDTAAVPPVPGHGLFLLSARSEPALRGQAARLARHLGDGTPLTDVAHTLARHRGHFEWRAGPVAGDRDELLALLDALASGRMPVSPVTADPAGKVAFVFAGHGGQWPGMGLELMGQSPQFRDELHRVDEAVRRHAGWSVLNVLRAPEEFSPLERTEYLQPVLFAVNAALAAAWRALGVRPDAVAGHSLGEIAAAYTAGALGLDDAVTVVTARAHAVVPHVGHGGMLAVELPPDEVGDLLSAAGGRLFVAAVNGPRSTAVSGEAGALAELRGRLEERGVTVRPLSTPFASHTPLMEPLRDELLARFGDIRPTPSDVPLYSAVLAECVPGERLDAAHWFDNLRRPVRFADTVRRLLDDGYRHFVELSPHPSLTGSVEAVAADAGIAVSAVGSLRRQQDGRNVLLRRAGDLYAGGHTPDPAVLFPAGRPTVLPTYAFARSRHWLAPAPAAAPGTPPLLGTHVEAADEPGRHLFQTEIDLRDSRFAYLADHRVGGEVWLPAAAFLEAVLEAAAALDSGAGAELTDIAFLRPLRLPDDGPVRLQLVLRPAEDGVRDVTVLAAAPGARWHQHLTGRLRTGPPPAPADREPPAALRARATGQADLTALYGRFAALGIDYGPAFRGLAEGHRADGAALARLTGRPAEGHLIHPALLDAALHTAALPDGAPTDRAFVPAGTGRLRFTGRRTAPAWVTCHPRSLSGDTLTCDLRLWDADEHLVLEAEDLRLAALSPLDGALFETRWQPRPDPAGRPDRGSWLILADATGTAAGLTGRLDPSVPHVVARRGPRFAAEGPGRYVLDTADPDQLARLLDEEFADAPPSRVVQLSALDAPAVTDDRTAEEAARLCCLTTLHLVRALAGRGPAPRLFVVVRGSQAAGDSTRVAHPQQALAWGFGLALDQEHPELSTTLIDLPETDGTDALWTALAHADDERLVALRDTGRLVPRLTRARPDDDGAGVSPDGVHLVTGGLGGLGRVVAEQLVRRGARRLALLSRGTPDADTAAWIAGLRDDGVTVHLARADVADRAALTFALDTLRRDAGPVASVVHTAGVLDDATVANLTDERVLRVLAPKVLGTALLTELTPEADGLVLFASAAGLLGSAGQAPYSAANAFLDAWAHHLSRAGRPALSLDWGAWSGVGMAAASATRAAETGRSGLLPFTPQEGGELFARVLGTTRRQLAPLALDRELLALAPDLVRTRPLLGDLAGGTRAAGDTDGLAAKALAATTGADRATWLEAYVRARVNAVSGGTVDASGTAALKELGLDSLMLVRLRNDFARDLGVEIPAAEVFAATDTRGLARMLAEALPQRAAPTTAAPGEPDRGRPDVPDSELLPATRDVVRLLRSARPDMPAAAHGIGLAARVTTPVTREDLTALLARLAARHAALRTAVVPGPDGPRLRVDRAPAGPLLRWTTVTGPDDPGPGERLSALLEEPFDLAEQPLWRFEFVDGGERGRYLLLGAHHAVSDLQSLLLVAAEIDAELSGTPLDGTPDNRDLALLAEAQRTGPHDPEASTAWRSAFEGAARLDLTLSHPRPARRTYRAGSVTVPLPEELTARVAAAASRLAVTPAAYCLGVLTVLLARLRERERFVLAVPVDTRIHADAPGAVGFFGVPVPFPAQAGPGERIEEVLRRTDRRLRRILTRGAMFSDVLPALARQGLHRPEAPLVEVYFNYVRSGAGRMDHLEVLPAGTGWSDLDLMVTMTPDAGRIRLDHNLDILDAATTHGLAQEFLRLLETAAQDPSGTVAAEPAPRTAAGPGQQDGARPALAATFALGRLPLMCGTALDARHEHDRGPDHPRTTVAEAPYHQVLAALRDPSGVLADPRTDVGVVLLRGADLARFGPVDDTLLAELRTAYPQAVRDLAERTGKPLVVGILPTARPEDRFTHWEQEVTAALGEQNGVAVLGPDDWTRHHPVDERFDARTERLAHLPFTPQFQAAVALTLAEVVDTVRRPAPKVIAVDGDETLWGGVAGETGPDAVDLTGARRTLARQLLRLREAGALLVLVSNNDEDVVRAVLDRADSPLGPEHFSVLSAGWEPKPERLTRAARTLGLGLDSFLFLDDNPAEIARMRAALPQVLSVTCPPADRLPGFLRRLWPLVPAAVTAEDGLRARFYAQERERDAARAEAGFEEFLAGLELAVDIRPLADADVRRGEQLVRRTNQFVLRARASDGKDLQRWRAAGEVWTAAARDRFGDYGQIALLAVRADGDLLDVLAWAMSCRALGRGVEERLLQWLADRAGALGCTKVRLTADRTPRNAPARRLLAALGGGSPDDDRLEAVVTPEHLRTFRSWRTTDAPS